MARPAPTSRATPRGTPQPAPQPATPVDAHDLHHAGRPRIEWSRRELLDLGIGVAAITVCFALIRAPLEFPDRIVAAFTDGWTLLASFFAVSTGFVLHELGHKVLAHRYGHWAEFRADVRTLLVSVGLAAFFPFFIAAPGAVWIQGRPPPREYGLVSLVGPGVNVVMAAVAYGAYKLMEAIDPVFGVNQGPLELILAMVAVVNAFLAVFNLIPLNLPFLGSLDGLKVWRWSRIAWAVSFAASAALLVVVYMGPGQTLFDAGM
jgi:Zn-dependent protease